MREATRVLDARLDTITVADLLADVHRLDGERRRTQAADARTTGGNGG